MKEKIDFLKSITTKYERLKEIFTEKQLEFYFKRLPEEYFILSDEDDIIVHLKSLDSILDGTKKRIEFESDIEKFSIVYDDFTLLRKTIKSGYLENKENPKLLRIYRDKKNKFFIVGSYDKLKESGRNREVTLQEPVWGEFSIFDRNSNKKISIDHLYENHSVITLHLANVAFFTLIRNLLETLDKKDYSFIEIWMYKSYSPKIKTLYQVTIGFYDKLQDDLIFSIIEDLNRYLLKFLEPRSIFDIVGPSMVGSSSSHTAGANRIGQIARNFFIGLLDAKKINEIKGIKIKLMGSFRDTGVGHNTPEAIIGGLSGLQPDDENMIKRGFQAIKNKDTFHFEMKSANSGFGGFIKGGAKDDQFYEPEKNNNIAEIIASTDKRAISITGFSIGGGNVEIRYINRKKLNDIITGKQGVFINYENHSILEGKEEGAVFISAIEAESSADNRNHEPELTFNTFEEMIDSLGNNIESHKLITHILAYEQSVSGTSKEISLKKMKYYWRIMKNSVKKGLSDSSLTKFRLTGADSGKIDNFIQNNPLKENIYTKALRYSIAVNEVNAKNGVIVACPTAGACGMLPAILKAWEETKNNLTEAEKEKKIIEAMLVAGFFGMIFFDDVHTAGADLGCQAEVGGGAALASAALTYLEDGTLEQMVEAFTLTLKNSMGLICDPVAGLVEIPCVKRNGVYSSMAISAAFMALADVKSYISTDEVVLAVQEVGERMPKDYKETSRAGLAKTRDGKKIDRLFHKTTQKFFK